MVPLRLALRCRHSLLIRRLCSTVNGEIVRQTSSEGKEVNATTKSLRVDAVAAAGLAISRRKLWELAFDDSIYVNGSPIKKKSQEVNEGDIIEVDVCVSSEEEPSNKEVIKRGRVIVTEIGPKTARGRYRLTLKRYKQFLLYKRNK